MNNIYYKGLRIYVTFEEGAFKASLLGRYEAMVSKQYALSEKTVIKKMQREIDKIR